MQAEEPQQQNHNRPEITTGTRQDGETLLVRIAKEGRLTARELSRRRRQRLQQLIQQQAQPQTEQGSTERSPGTEGVV